VNDVELDRLIAATARVSDADARAWDLGGAEAQFMEDIVSTLDEAVASDGGPVPTGIDPGADAGTSDAEALAFPGTGRPPRRRLAAALGAAAAVLAIAGATTIAVAGDDGDGAATGPAGPATADAPDLQPAEPPHAFPVAPEDAAAAEALPRIAGGLEGWAITSVHAADSASGYMTMAKGARTLDVSWWPADDHAERLEIQEAGGNEGVAVTLAGQPALTFDHGPVPAPQDQREAADTSQASDPPYEAGAHGYMTIGVVGGHTVELLGGSFPPEEYEALVAGLQQYPADAWVGVLPTDTVLPSQRPAVVDEMLVGVPLPPGFDPEPLRTAPAFLGRFDVGADVSGAVACGWFESWVAARASGDQAAVQAAVDAMGTSPQWPVLLEMVETSVNFPGIIWQYAAAMPTDGPVAGGTETTVTEAYESALGCDKR
jgi:hypothetical protein